MSPLPLLVLLLVGHPPGLEGTGKPASGGAQQEKQVPFSPGAVRDVVTSRSGEIQGCYETAMARKGATAKNAPAGKVVMSWSITPDGIAADVRVQQSQISDPLVTDCMVQAIRTWTFPKPAKRQPVEFPFELHPASSKAKDAAKVE